MSDIRPFDDSKDTEFLEMLRAVEQQRLDWILNYHGIPKHLLGPSDKSRSWTLRLTGDSR